MNENELYLVKQYKFDNPTITEIDSILVKCFRDCHDKYFHKFKVEYLYDFKLINVINYKTIILTIIRKSMDLYDLNKKLEVARQIGFEFD